MKAVLIKVEGTLKANDLIVISGANPIHGGRNNARFDVPEPRDSIEVVNGHKTVVTAEPTMRDCVAALVAQINRWDGFKVRQRGDNELVVLCSDATETTRFWAEPTGDQQVSFEELC